jgi:hypothetical protein
MATGGSTNSKPTRTVFAVRRPIIFLSSIVVCSDKGMFYQRNDIAEKLKKCL